MEWAKLLAGILGMNRRTWLTRSIVTFTALAVASIARSEEFKPKRVRKLLEKLASPNQPPKLEDYRGANRPVSWPGWDVDRQKAVFKALDKLVAMGPGVIPHAIEFVDDKRYCGTMGNWRSENWQHYFVGDVCYLLLIEPWIVLYQPSHPYFSGCESFLDHYVYTVEKTADDGDIAPALRKWWQKREDLPIVDLQNEAIDWALSEGVFEQPKEDQSKIVAKLKKLRASALAADSPLRKDDKWRYMIDPKHDQSVSR